MVPSAGGYTSQAIFGYFYFFAFFAAAAAAASAGIRCCLICTGLQQTPQQLPIQMPHVLVPKMA